MKRRGCDRSPTHLWADVRRFLWAEIKQRDTSTVFVIHSSAVCDSVARGVMKAKRCESALRPQVSETSGRWIERVFFKPLPKAEK